MVSPSAGSRSARARASAKTCANSPRNSCRLTSRAISWASARRSTSSKRSIAASTCSIASCRRSSRSAAPSSPRAASCKCAAAFTNSPTKNSIPACACPTCARYSRAYLHHLTKTSETLGWQLLGKHNIHFYHQLMREIRAEHSGGSLPRSLSREARVSCTSRIATIPRFVAKAAAAEIAFARRLRSPYRPGRLRQHPADFFGRDHAFAHAADGRSAQPLHRAVEPRASAFAGRDANGQEPLVIWDVGLGAAANAMAAIHCYEEQAASGPVRPMRSYQLRKRSRLPPARAAP